jgi:hypothetical protein
MGATDPSSGTASVHEVVRGFGKLLKKGWKPLRTILIASWDAEEVGTSALLWLSLVLLTWIQYGLIGSTEWGEDFRDWIDEHVVAYVNLGRINTDLGLTTHFCTCLVFNRFLDFWISISRLCFPFTSTPRSSNR